MTTGKPEFATNRQGERVADAVNALLGHLRTTWKTLPDVAIATAYFNPGGFSLLADELEATGQVRLLLGAEPPSVQRQVRALRSGVSPLRAAHAQRREVLQQHETALLDDRDLLGFSVAADATGRRLVAWLHSGRVEVRRLESSFLHGKAFLVPTNAEGVLAGSSNFTYAGLSTNLELNLGQYNPSTVQQVVGWFDDLWEQAFPFDLAGIYADRYEPHQPGLIYLRMLWERYREELVEEAADQGLPSIRLTSFQRDGQWRARRILRERHGVLIADEVGLGKTYLAGELLREAVHERRQRAIVIAPATLRDGPWRKFLARYRLGDVECRSYDDLVAGKLNFAPHEYALVVVDEAHNLRTLSTQRAQALQRLLAGSPPKDLVLLTATPVNNSLWDLHALLYYFIKNDATFADVGIRSLRNHFAAAMAMNPDDLSPEHLFDVLDAVSVRRTRSFVRRYYANDTVDIDGVPTLITFPAARVRKVSYDLEDALPGFFPRFARALEGPQAAAAGNDAGVLTLARYMPSRYRLAGAAATHEVQLAGLLRSGLLKRFESSARAFALTCRTMASSHDDFLGRLDQGWVATGEALREWTSSGSDELEQLAAMLSRHRDNMEPVEDFDLEALRQDVDRDRDLLLGFATEAETVQASKDPKLAVVVEELAEIAAQAAGDGVDEGDRRDRRKVLVFSYFADTVDWVAERLRAVVEEDPRLAAYRGRVAAITGRAGSKEEVLWGFAPRTTDAPPASAEDRFDIVVTTDVLSEGVNLQQARHIVNYDLPWNPMRLVQRHGRIDRIGSRYDEVFLRCIFPDRQLDQLLGLEVRLQRKLRQALASVGVNEVLPGGPVADVSFTETRDEIERLQAEDPALFDRGGTERSVLSGEEYRQQLRAALEDPLLAERIERLPWSSGSGFVRPGGPGGFVFCARVANHPRVKFRWVEDAGPEGPVSIEDTLACLANARLAEGAQRVLDQGMHERAYLAWAQARTDVVTSWNLAADPANLAPTVSPTMQRAVELVRRSRPREMAMDEADRLVDRLQAPYPERILRQVRRVTGSDQPASERVRALARLADDVGLQPSPPPEPLPEIEDDDVHLVCWLAIAAGEVD
jgi:hypothetical protein